MTETNTTAQATTTNSADALSVSTPTANAAPAAKPAATQQEAPANQAPQAADAAKAVGDQAPEAPKGAPEKYEFKSPGEKNFDNEVMTSFSDIAKELNLTQDSAQKILDKVGSKMQERHAAGLAALSQEWAQASTADKEFGGDGLQQNLAIAKKALDTLGTPELRSLLHQSPLGNHPELIRFFYRTGKAISEDQQVVTGGTSGSNKPAVRDFATAAAALYSNQSQTQGT